MHTYGFKNHLNDVSCFIFVMSLKNQKYSGH